MKRYRKRIVKIKKCKYCDREFVGKTNQQYCSRKCATAWRKLYGFRYIPKGEKESTLCWGCRKATGREDCPWANKFEPVEGWTATPTEVKAGADGVVKSYEVHKCPLFVEG